MMNEFCAVSTEELTQIEGGNPVAIAVIGVAFGVGFAVGYFGGGNVCEAAVNIVKSYPGLR
jgi:hypothetical protein